MDINEAKAIMGGTHASSQAYAREQGVGPISDQVAAACKVAAAHDEKYGAGEYVIGQDLVIENQKPAGEGSQPSNNTTGSTIAEMIARSDAQDPETMQFFREQCGDSFESDFAACTQKLTTMFDS